ncbi:hypothetical protein L9F63_003224, partial [Diploptera punctata]
FDHVFGIRGEEEFDRVYQRIQLENRRIGVILRQTKITEVVLSLRILGNSLPILRKRQHSCMTDLYSSVVDSETTLYRTGNFTC